MLIDIHYSGEGLPFENIDAIRPHIRAWFLCGSQITCSPPVMDTDRDVMVLVHDAMELAVAAEMDGFSMGGSMPPVDCAAAFVYVSMRRGKDNLIFTGDQLFFDKFRAATAVSKRLNLLKKDDRIMLFQSVLYGNAC